MIYTTTLGNENHHIKTGINTTLEGKREMRRQIFLAPKLTEEKRSP